MSQKFMDYLSPSILKDFTSDFFILNCNNSITAIASDRDCKYLVIGGRECKK